MAERVLEVVIQRLAKLDRKSYPRQVITANIPLGFLPFSDPAEVGILIGQLEEELTQNQAPLNWPKGGSADTDENQKRYGNWRMATVTLPVSPRTFCVRSCVIQSPMK